MSLLEDDSDAYPSVTTTGHVPLGLHMALLAAPASAPRPATLPGWRSLTNEHHSAVAGKQPVLLNL